MSLSKWLLRMAAATAAGATILMAGCTISPVYGPTAGGRIPTAELAAITISSPPTPLNDPIVSRVEQEVRNDLVFAFTGGAAASPPRYTLRLNTIVNETLLGVTRIETAPSYSVHVAVSYELAEIKSGRIVARGVATGVASYDRFNQAFANTRARRDAEDRAASSAADDIRLRLAAALSAGA